MSTATQRFVSLTGDEAAPPAAVDRAAALRPVTYLAAAYAALSAATLLAIVVLRDHSGLVNSAVWTRGVIVVLSSLLTLRFARRAAGGHRRSFLRLRIISAVMVLAIAVIIALPGTFPGWMKAEQSVCGLLLIGVATLVNRRSLRTLFAQH